MQRHSAATQPDVATAVWKLLSHFWRLHGNYPYNPCPNPVSLSNEGWLHIIARSQEYGVCAKTDGTRYLLICGEITPDKVTGTLSSSSVPSPIVLGGTSKFIPKKVRQQKRRQYHVNSPFAQSVLNNLSRPKRFAILLDRAMQWYDITNYVEHQVPETLFCGTVLDGELVMGLQDAHSVYFDAFDIVAYAGKNMTQSSYDDARRDVLSRCLSDLAGVKEVPLLSEGTCLRQFSQKTIYSMRETAMLWRQMQEKPQLQCDGLIFMPLREPMGSRTQTSLFKWKREHTVDFLLRLEPCSSSSSSTTMGDDKVISGHIVRSSDQQRFAATLYFGDERKVPPDEIQYIVPLGDDRDLLFENRPVHVLLTTDWTEDDVEALDERGRELLLHCQSRDTLRRFVESHLTSNVSSLECVIECHLRYTPPPNTLDDSPWTIRAYVKCIRTDKSAPNNHTTLMESLRHLIRDHLAIEQILQVTAAMP
jgi:hypothetical protein